MGSPSGRRREQIELASSLRKRGHAWASIAAELRGHYGLNARVAMRVAHGWSQADAARAWNRRWPDDPKTYKTFSYWETWPSESGHAPSLAVLYRLARLYECDVVDLVCDWGRHGTGGTDDRSIPHDAGTTLDTAAWQVARLDVESLEAALKRWSERIDTPHRRSSLVKLSMAAASVASGSVDAAGVARSAPVAEELTGVWDSQYTYFSTGRAAEFNGHHEIVLRAENERLLGRSLPTSTGTVELDLTIDGNLVQGSWTEHTDADGYYHGAVYHGILQLVLDPPGRTMKGQWLGPDKNFVINSGDWTLIRKGRSDVATGAGASGRGSAAEP